MVRIVGAVCVYAFGLLGSLLEPHIMFFVSLCLSFVVQILQLSDAARGGQLHTPTSKQTYW